MFSKGFVSKMICLSKTIYLYKELEKVDKSHYHVNPLSVKLIKLDRKLRNSLQCINAPSLKYLSNK